MSESVVEQEICVNCKKEIPQYNYVMHTAHCARNISLCPVCKEPIPKNQLDEHKKQHAASTSSSKHSSSKNTSNASTSKSSYSNASGSAQKQSSTIEKQRQTTSSSVNTSSSYTKQVNNRIEANTPAVAMPTSDYAKSSKDSLLPCKFCDLELPKLDLEDHENYCGARTDKCIECGELVMFKYKKLHEDSNHGFIKLTDEPGPRPSWDSNTQRTSTTASNNTDSDYTRRRSRLPPLRPFDMTPLYNMADYIPPTRSTPGRYATSNNNAEKQESYKDISRRLDCKTEYIRNLLHDSASITVPLRSGGTVPRNHFNHQKGPAPLPPPAARRRNPPTELTIPCEFCDTPMPHEDLIQHESGCRPDLARYNPRRNLPELSDELFVAPQRPQMQPQKQPPMHKSKPQMQQQQMQQPNSPEIDLPCEFCCDMIPASQLLRHQATCN